MNRAVVIPFHKHMANFSGNFQEPIVESFIRHLSIWSDEFDKLYIIDGKSGFNEDQKDRIRLIKQNVVFWEPKRDGHHWIQYRDFLPLVEEESILCLDQDFLIWKKGIIDNWFKAVEGDFDVAIALDGSSSFDLKTKILDKFPLLLSIENIKMVSSCFLITKTMLQKIGDCELAPIHYEIGTYIPELDYTTKEGDWFDSFGLFSIKLFAQNPKIYQIEDDRSIIVTDGKKYRQDASSKKLGYYHVRNGSAPIFLLAHRKNNDPQFLDYINAQPKEETLRLFAWYWLMGGKKFMDKVLFKELGIDYNYWLNYIVDFKEFHEYE